MISYKYDTVGISAADLEPFFEEWPVKPAPEKRLQILNNSHHVIIATVENKVVGFINAITDKTISAYIPLLEVIPEYRNRGIGSELVRRMVTLLNQYYMIDICCDKDMEKFYNKLGFTTLTAMAIRNYDRI
ncbi:MAG: GNAT family N-acetyltransferase [Ignavibacteria bacterium]|nr:GNAT family N-acetyltransferase [Ignavibacteria bacterium]